MALNAKPLPRQRTLLGLLAAVEQQPRLWLPLQLQADQFWVWSVPFVAVMLVASLWSLVADLLGAGLVGSLVALVLMAIGAAGATWGAMRTQRRRQRAGWEVSFEHRTLTPVGLPGRDTITLGPEFSLGCWLAVRGIRTASQQTPDQMSLASRSSSSMAVPLSPCIMPSGLMRIAPPFVVA